MTSKQNVYGMTVYSLLALHYVFTIKSFLLRQCASKEVCCNLKLMMPFETIVNLKCGEKINIANIKAFFCPFVDMLISLTSLVLTLFEEGLKKDQTHLSCIQKGFFFFNAHICIGILCK